MLVDLDPQFNATQYVMDFSDFDTHRKSKGTIADLLIDQPGLHLRRKSTKKSPASAIHTIEQGATARFDLLPSELSLGWVVKNPAQMDYKLEKLLSVIRDRYDYVFIDCAPTDSVLTTMALTTSDFVLIPVRPDRFSVLGFANVQQTIAAFRANCNDPHDVKTVGLVFTQVAGNSNVETDCITEIRATAKKQNEYIFQSQSKYSTSFTRSVQDQKPIFQTAWASQEARTGIPKIAAEMEMRITTIGSA